MPGKLRLAVPLLSFVQCFDPPGETSRRSKRSTHSDAVVCAQGDCQQDRRLREAANRGWAEGGPSTYGGSGGWPDNYVGRLTVMCQ
jgi:hypothetical protein